MDHDCGVCDQKVATNDHFCAEWKIMTDSPFNSNLSSTIAMHCSADLFSLFPICVSRHIIIWSLRKDRKSRQGGNSLETKE